MPYADVNGVRLHYTERGSGDLVLFLHGFPEFSHMWRDQVAEIGRDYHAVAPDMRGYNLSSQPPEQDAYRIPVLVEDVRQLASKLTDRPFVLVAHDWGGGVAWAFAAMHPQLLRGLVLCNMPHWATFVRELRSNEAQQHASTYMTLFRTPGFESTLGSNIESGLTATVLGPDASEEDKQAYGRAWSHGLAGGLNYYRAASLGPPTDDRPDVIDPSLLGVIDTKVDVPTLIVWGMQDTALLPGCLDGIEDWVPNLRLVRVEDASHWIVREKSDLVTSEIRKFLGSL
jgi:pimeloyl-ACP methyl ester carboxylesterase